MPKDILPIQIDPYRLAENAMRLKGVIPLKTMERLNASLANQEGDAEVSLEFGIDHEGVNFIKGHIETHMTLECQRCLQPFSYTIVDDFLSGLVSNEDEAQVLPEVYDPVIVDEENLNIQDVIEDELIISLPIVPLHDPKDCQVSTPFAVESSNVVEVGRESPFKVIESLRTKKKQE